MVIRKPLSLRQLTLLHQPVLVAFLLISLLSSIPRHAAAACTAIGPICVEDAYLFEPVIIMPDLSSAVVQSTLVQTQSVWINAVPDPTGYESLVVEKQNKQSSGIVVIAPVEEWITLTAKAKAQTGKTLTRWEPETPDPIPPPAVDDPVPPSGHGSVVRPPKKPPPPQPDPTPEECPGDEYKICPVEIKYSWNTNEATTVFEPNKVEAATIKTQGFKVGEYRFTHVTQDPPPRPCCFSGPGYYKKTVPVIIAEATADKFVGDSSFLTSNATLPDAGCHINTETILSPAAANQGAPTKWYKHAIRYRGVVYEGDSPVGSFEKNTGVRVAKFNIKSGFLGQFTLLKKYGSKQPEWQESQKITVFRVKQMQPLDGYADHQIFAKPDVQSTVANFEIEAEVEPRGAQPNNGQITWTVNPSTAAILSQSRGNNARYIRFEQKPGYVSQRYDDIEVKAIAGPCVGPAIPAPTTGSSTNPPTLPPGTTYVP